jgi:hypothetical protein
MKLLIFKDVNESMRLSGSRVLPYPLIDTNSNLIFKIKTFFNDFSKFKILHPLNLKIPPTGLHLICSRYDDFVAPKNEVRINFTKLNGGELRARNIIQINGIDNFRPLFLINSLLSLSHTHSMAEQAEILHKQSNGGRQTKEERRKKRGG